MSGIRLIVGLGNPGNEYARTRHNAGCWFLDALAAQSRVILGADRKLHAETAKAVIDARPVWLMKPTTFMNHSGRAVLAALNYFKVAPEEMLVVHDDLDLATGVARLKFDGGHGGQNGLRDIFAQLGHGRFHRLRLGIGHPGHRDQVTPWVLGRPGKEDESAIQDALTRALHVLPDLVSAQFEKATRDLHTAK